MAEAAGLVLGVLGITGLFKACIDNFDIVIRAKEFSEDFDLLCTQLALQRIRLVLWGESLGLDPSETSRVNPALDRPDIKPVVEESLNHLRLLLDKANVVTNRFELKEGNELDAPLPSWKGMALFRDRFEAFRRRIHANQKQKSVLKVTRWAVHDAAAFKDTVDKIKELVDSLESITSALENLLKRQRAALVQEIESISDTRSLRLIQKASASSQGVANSTSQRLIEDAASQMISLVEGSVAPASSGDPRSCDSFYTAPEEGSTQFPNDRGVSYFMAKGDPMRERLEEARARGTSQPTEAILLLPGDAPDPSQATQDSAELPGPMPPADDPTGIPQNRRLMADLLSKTSGSFIRPPLSFGSGEGDYGSSISPIKAENERRWERSSPNLICKADGGQPVARCVFLELRSIRLANVPFISATPLDGRLDTILACIEGPPDTPYQGGAFWISIKMPEDPARPPLVKFQTRVFHPNIDCTGRICADYQSWWDDPHLTRYLLSLGSRRRFSWFSGHSSTRYSLGALLTALCALLASPDIDDPLVPEIAEMYVRNYEQYEQTARMYTARHASGRRMPGLEDLDLEYAERQEAVSSSMRPASTLAPDPNQRIRFEASDNSSLHGSYSRSTTSLFPDNESIEGSVVSNATTPSGAYDILSLERKYRVLDEIPGYDGSDEIPGYGGSAIPRTPPGTPISPISPVADITELKGDVDSFEDIII